MKSKVLLFVLLFAGLGFGDTLKLKDGKVMVGTYLGGGAREIRMAVGDKVLTFKVDEIQSLQFGSSQPEPQPARSQRTVSASRTASPPGDAIPARTTLFIRMIDAVDSRVNKVGDSFRATLDKPVIIGGKTVLPRGADVLVKLVEDQQAGKLTGRTELTLDMVSITFRGRTYHVDTEEVTSASNSRTGQTAKVVGGLGALGAIIGAISGGGKGAAIGAVSGAGAGTAIQVLTKGPQVQIPSETQLSFTLQRPMRL
jgi:hypothetical protein